MPMAPQTTDRSKGTHRIQKAVQRGAKSTVYRPLEPILGEGDSKVCHAAFCAGRLLLGADIIADGIVDQHLVTIFSLQNLEGLQRVRMGAHHHIHSRVQEDLCPFCLEVIRSLLILCTPVGEYDHEIGSFFSLGDVRPDLCFLLQQMHRIG